MTIEKTKSCVCGCARRLGEKGGTTVEERGWGGDCCRRWEEAVAVVGKGGRIDICSCRRGESRRQLEKEEGGQHLRLWWETYDG
uniref:Uncharacterized protein n=1 Tax=Cucumis melo TaxID=3656 RepID=A0A9I9DSM0_CUCME